MKIKCTIDMDLETKDYEMNFRTEDGTSKGLDYYEVKDFLEKIFSDWTKQVEELGIDSDDNITKEIH